MNSDFKSLRRKCEVLSRLFQQEILHNSDKGIVGPFYFFFFFAEAFAELAAAFAASLAAALFSLLAGSCFLAESCDFSEPLCFLSLPLPSFCFGGSLIPESFRRIFSRSSTVLPRPASCCANIWSITASYFGPAGMPILVNSSRTSGIVPRSGRHLCRYALILESAAEL